MRWVQVKGSLVALQQRLEHSGEVSHDVYLGSKRLGNVCRIADSQWSAESDRGKHCGTTRRDALEFLLEGERV